VLEISGLQSVGEIRSIGIFIIHTKNLDANDTESPCLKKKKTNLAMLRKHFQVAENAESIMIFFCLLLRSAWLMSVVQNR